MKSPARHHDILNLSKHFVKHNFLTFSKLFVTIIFKPFRNFFTTAHQEVLSPQWNKQENCVFYCVCINIEMLTLNWTPQMYGLVNVANNLDPCQNGKMQKHNVHFGTQTKVSCEHWWLDKAPLRDIFTKTSCHQVQTSCLVKITSKCAFKMCFLPVLTGKNHWVHPLWLSRVFWMNPCAACPSQETSGLIQHQGSSNFNLCAWQPLWPGLETSIQSPNQPSSSSALLLVWESRAGTTNMAAGTMWRPSGHVGWTCDILDLC